MVPSIRYSTVAGIPLPDLVKMKWTTQKKLDAIVQRTRDGGGEIVGLLGNGSAFYASSAIAMAESYLKDKKRVLPCAAKLNGEYGVKDFTLASRLLSARRESNALLKVKLDANEKRQFNSPLNPLKVWLRW